MRRSSLLLLVGLAALACNKTKTADDTGEDPDFSYLDSDGDGILDVHEGYVDPDNAELEGESRDTDGDGTADYLDLDSDNDTISDQVESGDDDVLTLPFDSDADGTADYLDLDSDGNCVPDETEGAGDMDEDGIGFFADLDDDGDGILDWVEVVADDCIIPDSDGDGRPDYRDRDADGDSVGDVWEAQTSAWEEVPGDVDADLTYNYLDDDSDGDGFTDNQEGGVDNPELEPRDTDGDGIYDFLDIDSDGDGLTDEAERDLYGTSPYNTDTDGDGYTDGAEVSAGTDPKDDEDIITGLYVVVPERTSVEEVFEFELSVQMGDVAFLIDSTGSMSGTLNGMATEFSQIVTELNAVLPDAEYGVATYDDYAFGSYGYSSSGDKPFILFQQVTDNISAVQTSLSGLTTHYGGDGPESGMEGLYQGLAGVGYDQNCNGTYDSATDVLPFLSSSSDPFGGSGGQSFNSSSSGGGDIGGYGFRDYALPVIVYATDNIMRDPDAGYGTPGGCPLDAGASDVISAANSTGAYLIGIQANSYTTSLLPQMNALSDGTGSYADTDGDGTADDRLVFQWSGSSSALRTTITNALQDLVGSVQFSEISLAIEGDEHGFVTAIDPESYTLSSSASGQIVDFTLEFRGAVAALEEDQLFEVTLNVVGDGTVLLDTLTIYVLVPGTSY
jgi:hypothetical protein